MQNSLINACKWIGWIAIGFVAVLSFTWGWYLIIDEPPPAKLENVLCSIVDWTTKVFIGWTLGRYFKKRAESK